MDTTIRHPPHVPPELVRDFDFYRVPGGETDIHVAWKRVQEEYPEIFWTPHYGGHWVVTRADDVDRLQLDHDLFSMRGHAVPRNLSPNLPLELDPPAHGPIRTILNPLFAPVVARRLETVARETAIRLIDGFKPTGRCEFISQFGRQLPIKLFLSLVDLPDDDQQMLLDLAEIRVRGGEPVKREAAKRSLLAYLEKTIRDRRANPRDDVVSKIVAAEVNGEMIPIETAQNLLSVVMFGGLDTVATMMGFFVRWLALDVPLRQRLITSPDVIPRAIDEMLRRHGMVASGREVTRDVEYKGVQFRKGEQILVPNMLQGLDPERYPDPMNVIIDRPDAAKAAVFGAGPHRCPGANLGKSELRVFLEEWLARIPDFSLDPGNPPVMATGLVSAIIRLPLVWTP